MAETSTKAEYVVGVDLGGTKIYSGIFDNSLEYVGTAKVSTKAQRGTDAVIERIARCVQDAVDESDLSLKQLRGIGVGAPGAVDAEAGSVIFAPNLGWRDKPRHVVGIFVGTGIGGGLVLNGEPYRGANHTGGEIGHMVIDVDGPKCSCGNKGCFEALASRTAIFQQIKTAVKNGQKTLLTEMLGNDLEDLRSGDLRKAIRRGDKFVEKVVEEAAEYTGIAVANLVNLLNPEIVVLGGGVIEALADEMMAIIVEMARDCILSGTSKDVQIIASTLGDNAGITGGAVLAKRLTK